jgi:hypothetical protein
MDERIMIGNNWKLDASAGVDQPTLRIDDMTVGGTQAG